MQASGAIRHDIILNFFNKVVQNDKVPHAMLFTGPKGSGKLAHAILLAEMLLCQSDDKPGGSCSNKVKKLIHPDLHFAFPVKAIDADQAKSKKKREDVTSKDYLKEWRSFVETLPYGDMEKWAHFLKGGDKNFNINVKECNEIMKNLALQSYEGGYKIQIIWGADYLGKDGNRLLKLIEEPTDKTVIILIADQQEGLLNTILSRCQILQFPPYNDAQIAEGLSESGLGANQVQEIGFLASGNMDMALDLANESSINFSEELLNWLRAAHQGNLEQILQWLEPMLKNGKAVQKAFLKYGLHFFKEYMRSLQIGNFENVRLKEEEKNTVLKMRRIIDFNKAEKIVRLLDECIYHLGRNVNNRLMFIHKSYQIETVLKAQ